MSSVEQEANPEREHNLASDHGEALARLREQVAGAVHTPDSPSWDQVRTPWLVNVDQRPLAILEAANEDDVATAISWARAHQISVAAQGSGHGAGLDLTGALLVRTRALTEISVDRSRRTARIGAGVTSAMLSEKLAGTGLAFLVGSHPGPSVVGLTLAGGLSWFGRAFGLGCDSIVSAVWDIPISGDRERTGLNAHGMPRFQLVDVPIDCLWPWDA